MKSLPPIPKTVPSVLGPISVLRASNLKDERGRELLGRWKCAERTIEIEREKIHRVTEWETFWHEWVHAILFDAGVKLKDDDAERVCDAIALARTRELLDK